MSASDLKQKDLIGAPWLLAFALRADGWWLRACNIWDRPNPMPESVRDRCTVSHSYIFQFAKALRYFWDGVAIQDDAAWERWGAQTSPKYDGAGNGKGDLIGDRREELAEVGKRWPRSVWRIPTEPNGLALCEACGAYWERGAPAEHCGQRVVAHYAAFPEKLVERIIRCGTSERGVCGECGAPWVRVVDGKVTNPGNRSTNGVKPRTIEGRGFDARRERVDSTIDWRPSCDHDAPTIRATVLDCFAGSGTTLLAARRLGRRSIGIELRSAYARMTVKRLERWHVRGFTAAPDVHDAQTALEV